MIKSITVTNHLGESIKLELGFPEKSGVLINSIEGLGPNKAHINTTEMSSNDGSLFSSARVPSRNIVLDLGFMWAPTIEDVRQKTYKYFPIKKRVKILIETDNRICEIFGYIESNEPTIFTKNEGTLISIICPDPYFYAANKVSTVFSGVDPVFEFPFSNESLTDNLIEFGQIKVDTARNIYYDGDADVGVVITISVYGAASNIIIYNAGTHETMTIDTDKIELVTGTPLAVSDTIIISTIKGDKSILLLRNGVYINIMNCLDRDSDWFVLTRGNNVFAYTAGGGEANLLFAIEHQILYEGV